MWNHFPSGPYSLFFFIFRKNENQSWALARDFFLQFFNVDFFFPPKKIRHCSHIHSKKEFQKILNFFNQKMTKFVAKKKKNHRSWPFMIEMSKAWGTHSKQHLGSRAIQDPTMPFSFLIGSMHTCSLPLSLPLPHP